MVAASPPAPLYPFPGPSLSLAVPLSSDFLPPDSFYSSFPARLCPDLSPGTVSSVLLCLFSLSLFLGGGSRSSAGFGSGLVQPSALILWSH